MIHEAIHELTLAAENENGHTASVLGSRSLLRPNVILRSFGEAQDKLAEESACFTRCLKADASLSLGMTAG